LIAVIAVYVVIIQKSKRKKAENVQAVKNAIKCQNCGAEMPDNLKFCQECGKPLEQKKNICQNCNSEMPDGVVFCLNCGSRLG